MASPLHFSKREEVYLKGINFSEIQRVISEIRSYFPKQETSDKRTVDFDDGQGISFRDNLEEVVATYTKKGLKPERISTSFVHVYRRGGSRIVLLHVWLNHNKLEISIGVQSGVTADIDWAKSKADSVKTLVTPLAVSEIKQVIKDAPPSVSTVDKKVVERKNKKTIDWKWLVGIVVAILTLLVTWLIYAKG